jgi:hypothetical protein
MIPNTGSESSFLLSLASVLLSTALLPACGSSSSSEQPADGTGGSAAALGPACGPVAQLISDFTYVEGASTDSAVVGTPQETFSGRASGYGTGMTTDVTGSDAHVSGMVTANAGFHVVFDDQCIADASQFQGISFDMWGSISDEAPSKTIAFWVATVEDTATAEWLANAPSANPAAAGGATGAGGASSSTTPPARSSLPSMPGTCTPTSGNKIIHPGCRNPSYSVELSATEADQKVVVNWSDFSGGEPNADASPGKITYIGWRLPQAMGMGTATVTPFTADIHIDNIAFIPR